MAPFDSLSADEALMLDALIVDWHERENIKISELMSDTRYGAGPTIYRRIIALREKGLVHLRPDKNDKRVKFVEPTTLAKQYMGSVGACISQLDNAIRST